MNAFDAKLLPIGDCVRCGHGLAVHGGYPTFDGACAACACGRSCDFDHPHPNHPCGVAGRIEDHPGTVMVDDLSHADLKALMAGLGLSLRQERP